MQQLFVLTNLQTTIGFNMTLLDGVHPSVYNLKDIFRLYVEHQHSVIINVYNELLKKAKARKHILEGYIIGIRHLEAIVQLIKKSSDKSVARASLMDIYSLSEIQANAILEMQLVRFTGLDSKKIEEELASIILKIAEYTAIISSEDLRKGLMIKNLDEIIKTFGDARRTEILDISFKKEKTKEEIPSVDVLIKVTPNDKISRHNKSKNSLTQKRGGKGVTLPIRHLLDANTKEDLFTITNAGKVYRVPVDQLIEVDIKNEGVSVFELFDIDRSEKPIVYFTTSSSDGHLLFLTANGLVKKTQVSEYTSVKRNGTIAIKLREGDELVDVTISKDKHCVIGTKNGKFLKFDTSSISETGRVSSGVAGIKLKEGDRPIGIAEVSDQTMIVMGRANGHGGAVDLNELGVATRNTLGRQISTDEIVDFTLCTPRNELCIVGDKTITIPATSISPTVKFIAGVKLINGSINSIFTL
jgi:DNA gyrase subunit A